MASAALHILDLEIASSLRRQRVFRDRLNPLDEYSDVEFIARYRISRFIFMELLNEIPSKLFRSTTRSHSIVLSKCHELKLMAFHKHLYQGVSLQCVMA